MAAYADCIKRLAQNAGHALSDDAVLSIYRLVHKAALDIKAGRVDPENITLAKTRNLNIPSTAGGDDLIKLAAQKAAMEFQHKARVVKKQAELQVLKMNSRIDDFHKLIRGGVHPVKARDMLVYNDYGNRGSVESLEQHHNGVQSELFRDALPLFEALKGHLGGTIADEGRQLDLLHELGGKDTGNAVAKAGAKAFHDIAMKALKWANDLGADIGILDGWHNPQHHSQSKVSQAALINAGKASDDVDINRRYWVDDYMGWIAKDRYQDIYGEQMTDAEIRETLEAAFDSISTHGIISKPGKHEGIGKIANRHSEHRVIHFKDTDAQIEAWRKYGDKSVAEVLVGHIEKIARDIAIMEMMGPNDKLTWKTLGDLALQELQTGPLADRKDIDKHRAAIDKADIHYDYSTGRIKPSYNERFSGFMDGVAHLNTAGKLGSAAGASLFGDRTMHMAVSHYNDIPVYRAYMDSLTLLNPANSDMRLDLQANGLMLRHMISSLHRYYDNYSSNGTWSRITGQIAQGVMKYTGMTHINEMPKGAFAAGLFRRLGEAVKKNLEYGELKSEGVRALRNYGITPVDWAIWKMAKLHDIGMGEMLLPENIGKITDEQMAGVMHHEIEAITARYDAEIAELLERTEKGEERFAKKMLVLAAALAKHEERMAKLGALKGEGVADAARKSMDRVRGAVDEMYGAMNREEQGQVDRIFEGRADVIANKIARSELSLGKQIGTAGEHLRAASIRLRERVEALDEWRQKAELKAARRQAVIDRLTAERSSVIAKTIERARRAAVVKLLGVVNTEADFAIVTPGWKDRAQMYSRIRRGTLGGEIAQQFMQFKSFPWAYLKRSADLLRNADGPAATTMVTAYLIGMNAAMGGLYLQVQQLLSGRDPLRMTGDWKTTAKFWGNAMLRSGALGIYGDFLYGANQTRYGSGPLEVISGPTLGPFMEVALQQPLHALSKLSEGEETHFLARTLQDVKGWIPGQNIWYLKAALDRYIWHQVFETLSPGYLHAMRKRVYRTYKQKHWWEPGEFAPKRAPDLTAALGD